MLFHIGIVILLCLTVPASLTPKRRSTGSADGTKTPVASDVTGNVNAPGDKPSTKVLDSKGEPALDETHTGGFDSPKTDSDTLSVEHLEEPKLSEVVAAVDEDKGDANDGAYAGDKLANEKAIIFAGCAGGMLVLCIIGFLVFKQIGRRRTPRTNEFNDYAYGSAPT